MKKKQIIILSALTLLFLIIGIIFLNKNKELSQNNIEIIDATYSKCNPPKEYFYEDNNYKYSFPCIKSNSIFVKFPNGNKMLVTEALNTGKVTIKELIKAGLEIISEKK